MQNCPKCGYVRRASDHHVVDGICPQCGIAYDKWRARQQRGVSETRLQAVDDEHVGTFSERLAETFFCIPEQNDRLIWGFRVALVVAFTLWAGYFTLGGVDWNRIGSSFMHNVNLPFHEFGHVLFSPFGRFMTILGGSLFQILMPLIALAVFTFQYRDNFAAAIMLWWCGQSFVDVSPYILDARDRALPLIMGMGEEAHDWGNLLTMSGQLHNTENFAQTCFALGVLIMWLGLAWAAYLLHKMHLAVLQEG